MKLRILLINPWIYDFAAINLWSRPLGLLKVAEYLSQFDVEPALIDCINVYKIKNYGTGKYPKKIIEKPECIKSIPRRFGRYGISIDYFRESLIRNSSFDKHTVFSYILSGYDTDELKKLKLDVKEYNIS